MSCVFIFILFISNVISHSAYRKLSLQTGASVTIPCPYDRKYIHHKKYWCYHAAAAYNYCTIQAYANDTQGKVTVTDNPAESLFTVTMKDLQTGNTGSYWCVVEIEGITHDVIEQLSITVKAAPDLSVRESSVSGDEGGSVTVQCLYSAAYQNTQKKWCRFRDRSCNSVTRPDTSQNSAVNISDDGKSLFSVQMSGLKKSDGGWYWCSAGDLKVPVHISVHDPPPVVTTGVTTNTHHVTTHTTASKQHSASQTAASSSDETTSVSKYNLVPSNAPMHNSDKTISVSMSSTAATQTAVSNGHKTTENVEALIYGSLVAFLLLLVILVISICLKRKKCKSENQIKTRERISDTTVHAAECEETYSLIVKKKSRKNTSKEKSLEQPTFTAEDPIIYSTVTKPESSALKDNDDVTYSSVKIASKSKTVSTNVVEGETIYSSVVCQ
ncbi:polymeric immunoglobulin receptor-like isoform X2 [Silurus meridionalis]|uniref:polymeric immunoglobulin receptor-like isoform X2 n=1 Tax=Silurus meridionalis TaxID=175797 RepID=UPI001EEAD556|nr:polymeric immunoglobulin receptor-like isoform X2 [Silurus meridionalis]